MFAGLPGIGVGTLYYVLTALWMPLRECALLVRGESSLARWRLIALQLFFAASIVASVAAADRAMVWILGGSGPGSVGPARMLNDHLKVRVPTSILAAPITASFLLLLGVLVVVEVLRLFARPQPRPARLVDRAIGQAQGLGRHSRAPRELPVTISSRLSAFGSVADSES